jgi:hypothetical protein
MATTTYLAENLSPNIGETNEGFLICTNVVLARTGFQKYCGRELPRKQVEKLCLDIAPNEEVELYRPAEEVFHPDFIASLESKPLTDDHPPGDVFVDAENVERFGKGHIRNIRKGDEPLDTGDWPLIGDVISTHADLIDGIKSGKRGISLGYLYDLALDGNKILQVNLVGNHAAVVQKGRAGGEARINDSAPKEELVKEFNPDAEEFLAKSKSAEAPTTDKPKERKVSNRLMDLLGLGLKAKAADSATTPEELAEAAGEISKLREPAKSDLRGHAKDDEKEKEKEKAKDEKEEPKDEEREKLHAHLDKALDYKRAKDKKAGDADLKALRENLSSFFKEEEGEPEHAMDAEHDPKTCEVEDCAKCKDAAEKEDGKGKDSAPLVEPILDEAGKAKDALAQARDTALANEGAAAVLNALRPFVARVKDTDLHRAFDAASASINKGPRRTGTGSYSAFSDAAHARGKDAEEQTTAAQRTEKLNNMMASRHRKNVTSEVR